MTLLSGTDDRRSPLGPSIEEGGERLAVAVAIATAGRPAILLETVGELRAQTRAPDAILACPPTDRDIAGLAQQHPDVRILMGPRSLSY